jgi:serpin B
MKRLTCRLLFAAVVLLCAFGVARAEPHPIANASRPADQPSGARAPAGMDEFAFDVYRRLAADNAGKNVFCSPYSLYGALVMCAEGACGDTGLEMGQALRFGKDLRRQGKHVPDLTWDLSTVHPGLAGLNKRLMAPSGHELRVANALWVDESYRLHKWYLDAITKHYRGGVYGVDFKNDTRGAYRQINAWGDKKTNGRIKELLNEGTDRTRLVITNAIYFKGDWAEPFDAKDTLVEPFWPKGDGAGAAGQPLLAKTTIRSNMESARYGAFQAGGKPFATPQDLPQGRDETKLYPDSRGFLVLEMPYKRSDLSMVVVVPRGDDLTTIEELLTAANVKTWMENLEKREVHVHLPKFKMAMEYGMQRQLEALGMKRAFVDPLTSGGAEFEGMAATDDPREKLYVTRVVHKAFVEATETGTEAAATTAVEMAVPLSAAPIRPLTQPFTPTFKADRPFVFLIRDTKSGAILFVGRVNDPRSKS